MGGYPARGTAPFWSGPLATFCHPLCRHVGRGRKGASVCLLIAHQACARCFRHMTSFSPPPLFLMLSEAMTAFSRIKKKGWGDLLSSLHSAAGPGMCRVGWLCSNRQHESDSRSPSNPPPSMRLFQQAHRKERQLPQPTPRSSAGRGKKTWKGNGRGLGFLHPLAEAWAGWCLGLLAMSGFLTVGAGPLRPRDLMETCHRQCPKTQTPITLCPFFYQLRCFGLQIAKKVNRGRLKL